jgi:hypothetical protein
MTKIIFKRTGGIAGREMESNIDLNEMPDHESQELMRLISETNFFNIPQNLISTGTPDEYEYTVTVEAGNSHHTIHTSDSSASDSLRPLLDKLSLLARETNSGSLEV